MALALPALIALASCTSTTDSIGYNGNGMKLKPVTGPSTYPNPFKDLLGKTDVQIADRITATFNQLFYGDPGLQAIYVQMGADQASIQDTLHQDVRTEGIGLAMMICVQLDKRAEFDRLWTYANAQMKQNDPPRRGYFESWCDTGATTKMACDDPYGEAQMLMALIFAHDRWGSTTGAVNYEVGAVDLLTVMLHKQDENRGIVDGITNTFDIGAALPFDLPLVGRAGLSRPSIVMPAFYDLWAQATGDGFWTRAAATARAYLQRSADPTTGLTPVRATFAGEPYTGSQNFQSEAFRAQVNMASDQIWAKGEKDSWQVEEANHLLSFFTSQGATYGGAYTLQGMLLDPTLDQALIVVNGVTGMIATNADRTAYVNTVWDMATPTGLARYYSGILDLTALLMLGGQYRVW